MAYRAGLVFLFLLAMAMVAQSFDELMYNALNIPEHGHDGMELDMEDMLMESESARRQLYRSRYISYKALGRNNIPCNRRGNSYYNCKNRQRANPYRRGCTKATRCARAY